MKWWAIFFSPTGRTVFCATRDCRCDLFGNTKHTDCAIALFLVIAVFVATGMHLLPSPELLGVFFGAVLISNYTVRGRPLHERLKTHVWYLLVSIGAAASVFLNPAFTAMRRISETNGLLPLGHLSSTLELISLCFLVLVSIWIAARNLEEV